LIEATLTRDDSTSGEQVKNSSAPVRICDSMSVSPPSWLLGNIAISSRPPDSALILSAALCIATVTGWLACTWLPYL
jgi:hypothetical protein